METDDHLSARIKELEVQLQNAHMPHIDQIVYLSDQVSELDALVTHWASRAARAEDALREFRYLENREYQIGSMYFQDLITKVFEQIPPQHPWVGSTPSGEVK